MNKKIVARNQNVVIGADVHHKSHAVAVMSEGELLAQCVLPPNREAWTSFLKRFPGCAISVVYESGPQGYNLYDWLTQMKPMKGRKIEVAIAPPAMVPDAPGNKVKTDRRDAVRLIWAHKAKSFRPVVVPDKALRAERELVRTRERFKARKQRIKNQVHGFVKFHGLEYPPEKRWKPEWELRLLEQARRLDPGGNLECALDAEFLALRRAEEDLELLDKRIAELYVKGSRSELAKRIAGHPGIGLKTAMIIATEVADFSAFDNSDAFASYTGLVPGERSSGETRRGGRITRRGNPRLRWVFVECAWRWIVSDPQAGKKYEELKNRIGSRKAIVAMARKLAVRVYHLATA